MPASRRLLSVLALLLLPASLLHAQPDSPLDKQRAPRPDRFAVVFSLGYAGDFMPADNARFEALLVKVKAAGFNVVQAVPTDARLALCAKHDVQLMADLLDPSIHIYQNAAGARRLCERMRGNKALWGYNLWNDGLPATGGRFRQHVNNVRTWDPTHPVYLCTEDTRGMDKVPNADVISYWDYYWDRDVALAFQHLVPFWRWAKARDQQLYIWIGVKPGKPAGPADLLRTSYTVNTSLACGMKGILWFLASSIMDPKTLEWKPDAADVLAVNASLAHLGPQLARLGNPVALYSTPVTRTADNKPLPAAARRLPAGLEFAAFPRDFWLQPASGEFLLGLFKAGSQEFAFLANHNALAPQSLSLRLIKPTLKPSLLDRATGKWQPLPVKDGLLSLPLAPGGGELVRFD